MEGGEQQVSFEFRIAPELEAGHYANVLGVWHTPHDFTLDFSVTLPPVAPSDPNELPVIPCQIVSRVKVAPSLIFDLLRTLNENMTRYEAQYGEIQRLGQTGDKPE